MSHDTLVVLVTLANAAFTCCRIGAHVPQLIAVVRDTCGARAISLGSWCMFTLANASNAVYALVVAGDRPMFAINAISAASCLAIATAAAVKQRRWSRDHASLAAGDGFDVTTMRTAGADRFAR